MLSPDILPQIKHIIMDRTRGDKKLLDELRKEVSILRGSVRVVKPRTTTTVSLVASDGGNNKLVFDPFLIQLVRVVDSYGKQLCLEAITPTTDTDELSQDQFNPDGSAKTALGQMMLDLGVNPPTLNKISHMIPEGRKIREKPDEVSPSWVLVYRDLCEWAVLYERICHRSFATDTLIVRDGLLRSKLFKGELFISFRKKIEESIERIYREDRRHVFLVGVAKHSSVITRYQLALMIEGIIPSGEPRFVRIPRDLEEKSYVWREYARGSETERDGGEAPKFVAGDLHLVRFGSRSSDPIWAVDILSSQIQQAEKVFGYLYADAVNGFPVPYYPLCLQRAHEYAQIAGFDMEILQDQVLESVRDILPSNKRDVVEALRLNTDVAARRYE